MWRRHLRRLDSHKPLHNDGAVRPASAASAAEPPPHELDLHDDFEQLPMATASGNGGRIQPHETDGLS
jgi:hypothetical protein